MVKVSGIFCIETPGKKENKREQTNYKEQYFSTFDKPQRGERQSMQVEEERKREYGGDKGSLEMVYLWELVILQRF